MARMVDVQDVRWVALSLPETAEKSSYGTPGFLVRNKMFARVREHGDAVALWCADEGAKHAMVSAEPHKFFTTAQYDGYAIVLVRLAAITPDELSHLVTSSWRLRAPAELVAAVDASAAAWAGAATQPPPGPQPHAGPPPHVVPQSQVVTPPQGAASYPNGSRPGPQAHPGPPGS